MGKLQLVAILFLSGALYAQHSIYDEGDLRYPNKVLIGFGGGMTQIRSEWDSTVYRNLNFNRPTSFPVHFHSLPTVMVSAERRALWSMGPIFTDIRGEFGFFPRAVTDQEYLPDSIAGNVSDGGLKLGFSLLLKFALPFEVTPRSRFAPYLGFGISGLILGMTGDKAKTTMKGDTENLNYQTGWDEIVFTTPLAFGLHFDFPRWSINPDARYYPFGKGSTTWNEPESPRLKKVNGWTVGLYFGYKMGP